MSNVGGVKPNKPKKRKKTWIQRWYAVIFILLVFSGLASYAFVGMTTSTSNANGVNSTLISYYVIPFLNQQQQAQTQLEIWSNQINSWQAQVNNWISLTNLNVSQLQTQVGQILTWQGQINTWAEQVNVNLSDYLSFKSAIQSWQSTVNSFMTLVTGQISTLQSQMGTAQTNIITLQVQMVQVQADIVVLQITLQAEQVNIDLLQIQMAQAQLNIAALQATMTIVQANILTLQTQMNTANINIADLQARMLSAEAAITTLQALMNTANINIAVLQVQMVYCIGNITILQTQMTQALSDIATLQGQVSSLQSQVTVLNNWMNSVAPIVCPYDFLIYINGASYVAEFGKNNTVFATAITLSGLISQIPMAGSIYFTGGIYNIDSGESISVKSNQYFISDGATIYKTETSATDYAFACLNVENVTIKGFNFVGTGTGSITPLIQVENSNFTMITDCIFNNMAAIDKIRGISAVNSAYCIITNNQFTTCTRTDGVRLNNCSCFLVSNNNFFNCFYWVYLTNRCYNNTVTSNTGNFLFYRIYDNNFYDATFFNNLHDGSCGYITSIVPSVGGTPNNYGTRIQMIITIGSTATTVYFDNQTIASAVTSRIITVVMNAGDIIRISQTTGVVATIFKC
nr:hypothetical protein [Candidatus Freyarchaeota archaeon]